MQGIIYSVILKRFDATTIFNLITNMFATHYSTNLYIIIISLYLKFVL